MPTEVTERFVREVYRQILDPTFSPDELETLDSILDELTSGDAWGLCAVDGDAPVGCMLGYPYVDLGVLLVGYVAVKPGLRGGGVGHELMKAAEQRWYTQDGIDLVLAEVEDPRRYPATNDIDPIGRAKFYARRGAQVIVGPYFQPRLDEHKNRVHNLFLTVFSGRGEAITADNSVRAEQITDFLLEYFRDSGEGSDFPRADDDEGNNLLAFYRSRDTVPLHPIGDYAQIDIPPLTD